MLSMCLFLAGSARFVKTENTPANILYSVPVTLTNSQPAATPAPFQQMITVDSAAYSSHEAANLQNVEFFDSLGNIIPSWLESGNSNSATGTVYWLRLEEGIAANAILTIYMGFAATSTNLFNSQTTGEAPQLTPIYGQNDDGTNVFSAYWNFAGSSAPNGWTNNGATFNNGATTSWATDQWAETTATYTPQNYVVDFYCNCQSAASGNNWHNGWDNTIDGGTGFGATGGDYAVTFAFPSQGPSYDMYSPETPTGTTMHVLSLIWTTSSSSGDYASIDYAAFTAYNEGYQPPAAAHLLLNNNPAFYQWARLRTVPPNGFLPTVAINGQTRSTTPPKTMPTPSPSTTPSATATNNQSSSSPSPTATSSNNSGSMLIIQNWIIVIATIIGVIIAVIAYLNPRNKSSEK